MTNPVASISVYAGDRCACIRVMGRANFTLGVEFKLLLDELQAHDFGYFVLDLAGCSLMDSTFLGILTGFGLQQQQKHGEDQPSVIELHNPNERVAELIESLGVLSLFKLTHGTPLPTAGLKELEHTPTQPTRVETTQTCLEAHETLVAANPANAEKFKDVTRFLAEDLKRMKQKP
jgi:anti-anti-sigma regulatory factor